MEMRRLYRNTYAKIDLEAIRSNLRNLTANLKGNAQLMAVVKADAYGHGAVQIGRAAEEVGVGALAVELAEEGAVLREAGIELPIIALGHANPVQMELAVSCNIAQCVVDTGDVEILEKMAVAQGKKPLVHVKIDTGMGRIGLRSTQEFADMLQTFKHCKHVQFDGLFTHFACADELDQNFTVRQNEAFGEYIQMAKAAGFTPKLHAANSAAGIWLPAYEYDYVRAGISMYGYYPGDVPKDIVLLRPAMHVFAEISQIKTVPAGMPIGYGSTFVTKHETKVATVQIGYGDGYNRLLSNRGRMMVQGRNGYAYANILGRVCMDQTMIDVTGVEGLQAGDLASVMGKAGDLEVSADELAEICGTISYEILLDYSKRVPREYEG